MPATNCTANTSRRHRYAFSASGSTSLANRFAPISFSMKSTTNLAKDEGNNGLLHSRNEDYVIDKTAVSGSVSFNVRPLDMTWCLPLILGTSFTGNAIKAGAQCPFFRVGHVDDVLATLYTYVDCSVAKATFSSSDAQGGLLQLAMDIEACQSNQGAAAGFPALNLPTQPVLSHSFSTLTVNGIVRRMKDVQVVIDNQLLTDGYYNSRHRGDNPSDGQMIQLIHTSPFDSADELAYTNLTGSVSASLAYTNGPVSVTFDFPSLRFIAPEPEVGGRGSRVMNQYTWEACLATAADPATATPLTITVDSVI
jgi:hypothetical protein